MPVPNQRLRIIVLYAQFFTITQILSHGSPHFQQSTQFSSVSLLQTSLHWNSSSVYIRLPRQCNGITENIMPLPTRPLCCFWHYWPWHLDHPSLILECLFILSIWCWWACGGDDNLRNQKANGLNYTLSGCYGPERHARHWRITNLNWPICI